MTCVKRFYAGADIQTLKGCVFLLSPYEQDMQQHMKERSNQHAPNLQCCMALPSAIPAKLEACAVCEDAHQFQSVAQRVKVMGIEQPAVEQHAHINAGMNDTCIACKQQYLRHIRQTDTSN